MDFKLHPVLAEDCILLGQFELCQVLLMNDQQYPWLILVPKVNEIREVFELSEPQQQLLMQESNFVLKALNDGFGADKMNQAALGTVVPQLHIHHIVRYKDDVAWPGPVWGKVAAKPYDGKDLDRMLAKLNDLFGKHRTFVAH